MIKERVQEDMGESEKRPVCTLNRHLRDPCLIVNIRQWVMGAKKWKHILETTGKG